MNITLEKQNDNDVLNNNLYVMYYSFGNLIPGMEELCNLEKVTRIRTKRYNGTDTQTHIIMYII